MRRQNRPSRRSRPTGWERIALATLSERELDMYASLSGPEWMTLSRRYRIRTKDAVTLPVALAVLAGAGLLAAAIFLLTSVVGDRAYMLVAIPPIVCGAVVLWSSRRSTSFARPGLRAMRMRPVRCAEQGLGGDATGTLAERRRFWRRAGALSIGVGALRVASVFVWLSVAVAVLPAVIVVATGSAAFILVLPLLALPVVVLMVWGRRLRLLAVKGIEQGRCPHCGYSLEGLPVGLEDLPVAGPALCPECATEWPLVPPAAPDEVWGRLGARRVGESNSARSERSAERMAGATAR